MLYPIGIQDFEKIRKDGFVYVDKTDLVYKMAHKGGYYFPLPSSPFRQEPASFHAGSLLWTLWVTRS